MKELTSKSREELSSHMDALAVSSFFFAIMLCIIAALSSNFSGIILTSIILALAGISFIVSITAGISYFVLLRKIRKSESRTQDPAMGKR